MFVLRRALRGIIGLNSAVVSFIISDSKVASLEF